MPLIDWLWRKNALMTFFSAPTHKIMVRARAMLAERLAKSDSSNQRDFISRFLEAKEKHPETLNDRNMLGFVGSNLQAGSDTTAIALRTIMYHIMKEPAIAARMREELDTAGVEHFIPFQQVFNDFPYVSAVIKEALRIHPPFALLLERSVPASGLTLPDGTFLPQHTKVGMFGYTMHFDKEVFGEDAESFNPERWLQRAGESSDQFQSRLWLMKSLDLTFGHGQRKCVGVHVAELQIYKVVPVLVGLLDVSTDHFCLAYAAQGAC
jgi:cytochrome P450